MATLYPRGDRWYLNWHENGQQFRRSLGAVTAREAEEIRAAKEAELRHGVRILPRADTLAAFMDRYAEWYAPGHPTTAKRLTSEIKRFVHDFGRRPMDSLTPGEIDLWAAEQLKARAPETVGKELRRFRAAFNKAMGWKELESNPLAGVRIPHGTRSAAVKFYTAEQMRELAKRDRGPLWELLAYTGLRRGETTRVEQARDVVKVAKEYRLRIESLPDETGKGRTKSGLWREVPLNDRALACLERLDNRIADCHPDTLGDWFTADATATKVGGTLHRLRHTFCAHLAMAGVPLRRIQLLAGHANMKTTEAYAHLCPSGDKSAVDKLRF